MMRQVSSPVRRGAGRKGRKDLARSLPGFAFLVLFSFEAGLPAGGAGGSRGALPRTRRKNAVLFFLSVPRRSLHHLADKHPTPHVLVGTVARTKYNQPWDADP